MYGVEAMWLYTHARRGAGLYYRKGDHQIAQEGTKDRPTSMYKALNMYPTWDKMDHAEVRNNTSDLL